MTTLLPTSQRPVRTYAEWLDYVRHRLGQATRLDPWRGLLSASGGMGSRSETFWKWSAIGALAAAAITGFVLPWWAPTAAGATAVLGAAAWVRETRVNGARALARRQAADVAIGALVMANEGLFDPRDASDLPGVLLVTHDSALMRAPQRLVALASGLFALKGLDAAKVPEKLRAIATQLTSERGWFEPMPVPRSFAGNDETALFPLLFRRRELPFPLLERRIYPVLADRDLATRHVWLLPMEMWWRADIDAQLRKEFELAGRDDASEASGPEERA